MSNYTRVENFTAKDGLTPGDPEKAISGADVDSEFDAARTAINSKADLASPTFSGTVDLSGATVVGVFPAGVISPYAGTTEPSGWVFCDGSVYDSVGDTSFADLYTAIGNTYGGTDGTDFKVPDLRGRTIFGKDDMDGAGGTGGGDAAVMDDTDTHDLDGDTLGATGGTVEHTLTSAQSGVPAHTHTVTQVISGSGAVQLQTQGGASAITATIPANTAADASAAHPQVPPGIILNYIIKK